MTHRSLPVLISIALALGAWFPTRSLATEPPPTVSQALASVEKRIRSGEIPNVHGVIVVRQGVTLAEWDFDGADTRRDSGAIGVVKFDSATLHDVRSVTKSVVSLLFGIAMANGAIKNLDIPVLDFFPEYKNLQTTERRLITLRHLLSMSSGLRWDESSFPYTDPRNSETAMGVADDPMRYVLEQPLESLPGSQFRYSGGSVELIAQVLIRATKMNLEDFATQMLFEPLGITQLQWYKDARGVPYAASGLRLLPRDMAKIGQLMLAKGFQGGRQVVPETWVKAAVSPQAPFTNGGECGFNYGYFWWLLPTCAANPASGWYAAVGNGGHRIFVVPEQELVIVVTAGLYDDSQQTRVRQLIQGIRGALSN